jgi:phosphoglycolate phosphatase-like HAD superfamily hydrolase
MTNSFSPNFQPNATGDRDRLTVFCDFDGPIVDVSDRYYNTYQLGLERIQTVYQAQGQTIFAHKLTKEQFWQMKQERVSDIEIAMRSGLQEEQIELFLDCVRQIVNHPHLLQQDKIQVGVNWALALLHSQGARLILVTLRCQSQVKEILNNYGLKRLFSDIYGSQDCNVAYQNNASIKTELLRQAVARWGKDSAYMVGDTEADLIAAKAAGVSSIALTCGIRSALYLQQFQPDYIHSDLLSTAHHLLGLTKFIDRLCSVQW